MIKFVTKKIVYGLLVLVGVVILVFFLFQGFGDPSRIVMGQTGDSTTQSNIRKELYLINEKGESIPKFRQFLYYLNDVSPICFHSTADIDKKKLRGFFIGEGKKFGIKIPYLRKSYQSKREVGTILMQALPGTLMLAITAMFIAVLIGIPLGVMAAVKQNTWLDTTAIFSSIVGISAPSFFMGIIMVYLFGFVLSDWTGLHIAGSWFAIDDEGQRRLTMQNLILPAITLGIRPLAIITQLTRSAMLDVLDQDYIRTAYAKGLSKRTVIWKHGLRNALNPVITAITGWFAELLAGAFFVEYIFGWQGIGKVTVDALEKLDYPVVMGSVLVAATFFIIINILADILYGVVDPRVRVE
ncbi:MAG: ABC transporter permease [Chitinophagaceae bacterium]|nr:ABC transporter permease [Chitinophagaceae bacterium]MBL0307022.1 ABC transporter permease [Chitinophagaceae bacterium]HQV61758.1 ABC transporter permease [Chitinophagaceae bacterium]HQV86802.1 ABC transporter permease [Chitinophagaceae bacterium]HQX72837.1 ABC transporter permease [Chitinophagaceae bacterium]